MLDGYSSQIGIPQLGVNIDNYQSGVYRTGKNITNIVGLAYYHDAVPLKLRLKPLLYLLKEKYDINEEFTRQLCQQSGQSKMYFGPVPTKFKILKNTKRLYLRNNWL